MQNFAYDLDMMDWASGLMLDIFSCTSELWAMDD